MWPSAEQKIRYISMGVYERIHKMAQDVKRDEADSAYAVLLVDMLLLKETKSLMDDVTKLCNLNNNGEVHPSSYYYEGVLYKPPHTVSHNPLPIGTIRQTHEDEAEAIRVWKDKIDFDGQMMIQNLSSILENSNTLQDIRNRIPDEFAMVIPDLRGLKRTEEELFFITPDTEHLRDNYTIAKDLILYYVGNRLLM